MIVDAELVAQILNGRTEYETLCLEHDATTEQVRQRFKQLVVGLHPDKCKLPR